MLKSAMTQLQGQDMKSLKEVGWLLANQQRRIRTFVERTNLDAASAPQFLTAKLDVLLQTLERQWKCKLKRTIVPPDLQLAGSLSLDVFQLICEAIANAARHGKAREIDIDIRSSIDELSIRVQDDGVGMPINDEGAILVEPRSILKRVVDLKGTLDLSNTPAGTQLLIRIPAL